MVNSTNAFGGAPLAGALEALNRVREIQRCADLKEYDQPEIADDRVSFRVNYQEGLRQGWNNWAKTGDWSGYTVERKDGGEYDVLLQRMPERSKRRTQSLKASFSRLEDATKFVVVNVLDSVRSKCELETLFMTYRSLGLDQRVVQSPAGSAAKVKMRALLPPDKEDLIENHLAKFALKHDPLVYAIGFPGIIPYMNLLPLTYQELDTAVVAGLPRSTLDCLGHPFSRP